MGGEALACQISQAFLCPLRLHVAHGGHMAAGNEGKALDGTGAAHAQAHYADAHVFDGIGRKLEHVRLAGRPRRDRQLDGLGDVLAAKQKDCRKKED